jgi:hypothetical protein
MGFSSIRKRRDVALSVPECPLVAPFRLQKGCSAADFFLQPGTTMVRNVHLRDGAKCAT